MASRRCGQMDLFIKLSDGSLFREDRVRFLNIYDARANFDLGGNFLSGQKGSEVKLCYRTSFSLTFPEDELEADNDTSVAYSTRLVIERDNHNNGHAWGHA